MATRGGNGSERSGSIIRVVLLIAWSRGVTGACPAGQYDSCPSCSTYVCKPCSAVRWRRRLYAPAQQPVQPPNLSPPLLRAIAQGTYDPGSTSSCTSCAAVRLHALRVVLRVVALFLPAPYSYSPPTHPCIIRCFSFTPPYCFPSLPPQPHHFCTAGHV